MVSILQPILNKYKEKSLSSAPRDSAKALVVNYKKLQL